MHHACCPHVMRPCMAWHVLPAVLQPRCHTACAPLWPVVVAGAGVTRTDEGIMAALTAHVPPCLVALIGRGLDGDFRFEGDLMLLLEQLALCLAQICHHPYGKTAAREAEAYKGLAKLLPLQHRATVKAALKALMGMAVEKESKKEVMHYAGGWVGRTPRTPTRPGARANHAR